MSDDNDACRPAGDPALLIRLRDGNAVAFDTLVRSYGGALIKHAAAADTAYRRSVLNFGFFGDLWLLASVNAFGTVLRDSVKFTGIYPSMQMVTIDQHETLKTITSAQANQNFLLQPCGSVMFSNATAEQIDIIFDDPSAVNECVPGDETGNITALESGGMAIRKFRGLATRTWTVRNAAGTVLTAVSGKVTTKNVP